MWKNILLFNSISSYRVEITTTNSEEWKFNSWCIYMMKIKTIADNLVSIREPIPSKGFDSSCNQDWIIDTKLLCATLQIKQAWLLLRNFIVD